MSFTNIAAAPSPTVESWSLGWQGTSRTFQVRVGGGLLIVVEMLPSGNERIYIRTPYVIGLPSTLTAQQRTALLSAIETLMRGALGS
jgi:hypothetical protein